MSYSVSFLVLVLFAIIEPPEFVWQSAGLNWVTLTSGIVIVCVAVLIELPGKLACSLTVYFPGAEYLCVGLGISDELLAPDAGSPKSQFWIVTQASEVLVKETIPSPSQV